MVPVLSFLWPTPTLPPPHFCEVGEVATHSIVRCNWVGWSLEGKGGERLPQKSGLARSLQKHC